MDSRLATEDATYVEVSVTICGVCWLRIPLRENLPSFYGRIHRRENQTRLDVLIEIASAVRPERGENACHFAGQDVPDTPECRRYRFQRGQCG